MMVPATGKGWLLAMSIGLFCTVISLRLLLYGISVLGAANASIFKYSGAFDQPGGRKHHIWRSAWRNDNRGLLFGHHGDFTGVTGGKAQHQEAKGRSEK